MCIEVVVSHLQSLVFIFTAVRTLKLSLKQLVIMGVHAKIQTIPNEFCATVTHTVCH